jgi:broad specificity phosphatase PhoE
MATTILLARHGETDWNAARRVQGHTDVPLNERGREQARALAEELQDEPLDAVYASDLLRAHETARIVAASRGLGVTVLPQLRERNFGTWEGLTDVEVFDRFPQARAGQWGDAETREEMSGRVLQALGRIADAHPNGHVLVVAHGGPLRAVLHAAGGNPAADIVNCHVARLAVEGETVRALD